jgi:4-hydroxy-4-methyl-2-oxoglutarate aldolase
MDEKEKMGRLAEIGTATVYEASGRQGLVDLPLIQVVPESRVAGRARTVLCGQGDNVMVHACIEQIQPGEVVVLAQPKSQAVALIGDMLVTQMETAGAAGVLLNGAVRDFEVLIEMGLPIWTQFIRVRGATKTGIGRLNVPVAIGGNTINPGDIVVMDADGAVTIPLSRLNEILEKAEARAAKEDALRERYKNGERSYDLSGLRESVEALR